MDKGNGESPASFESKPHHGQAMLMNQKSLQTCIEQLFKSARLDTTQNLTWYYLGRAFACKGNNRDAFIAYKNIVNNPEFTDDTWCSIGILYFKQKQYIDALQAFICAVQIDKKHFAAWLNLAVLYEHDGQLSEALTCYRNALRSRVNSRDARPEGEAVESLDEADNEAVEDKSKRKELRLIYERTRILATYLESDKAVKQGQHSLPPLNQAFLLQIPSELRQKIVSNSQQSLRDVGFGPDNESTTSGSPKTSLSPNQTKANNQNNPKISPSNMEPPAKRIKTTKKVFFFNLMS